MVFATHAEAEMESDGAGLARLKTQETGAEDAVCFLEYNEMPYYRRGWVGQRQDSHLQPSHDPPIVAKSWLSNPICAKCVMEAAVSKQVCNPDPNLTPTQTLALPITRIPNPDLNPNPKVLEVTAHLPRVSNVV